MNNVLSRLAARRESWGKGKRRGRQGLLTFRDRVKPALSLSYKIQQKPVLCSDGSHRFPTQDLLLGASGKSSRQRSKLSRLQQ